MLLTWKYGEQKVFVYRNLHQQCWSVKSLTGRNYGRVIMHCSAVDLTCAHFKVNEKGRLRVIEEQAKNVHAGVVGYLEAAHVDSFNGKGIRTYVLTSLNTYHLAGTGTRRVNARL